MSDEEILQATWRALCTTGYADLTMQDIADETDKSKAALHYHYDSKHDLLEAFLDYVADRFLSRLRDADPGPGTDAAARLSTVLDVALSPPETEELELLQRALVELKAQAPHNERFRQHLRETDERFEAFLADIITAGIETGAFRADLDPEETAQFVVLLLAGSQLRQVSAGQDNETTRRLIETHFEQQIFAERGATPE
jgi:AcrR family transcriptional regulator